MLSEVLVLELVLRSRVLAPTLAAPVWNPFPSKDIDSIKGSNGPGVMAGIIAGSSQVPVLMHHQCHKPPQGSYIGGPRVDGLPLQTRELTKNSAHYIKSTLAQLTIGLYH